MVFVYSFLSRSDTNLQQRIEYLSRAVIAAKSSTRRTSAGNAEEGEFLHDLEEKLEANHHKERNR